MKRPDAAALAAIIALFLVLCAGIGIFHPDRSFVTYRYAENVAAGHGLVYNAGDAPSEGYANTLWLAKCAMMRATGLPLPIAAPLLSLFFGVATLVLLWMVVRAHTTLTASLVATGVAAASGPLAVAAMSGEGTSMTAALAVATALLLERAASRRLLWILAGGAGVLLAMCGNALGVVFPVALAIRLRNRHENGSLRAGGILAAVVFVAGMIAFHAWRFSVFGSLVAVAPGFDAARASLSDGFVSQPHDIAPFGWFYLMLFIAGLAGWRVSSEGRPLAALACGMAITTGLVTLSTRDPLPGLAGSAVLVPLLAIPMALLVEALPRAGRTPRIDALAVASLLVVCTGWAMDLRVSARHLRETHDVTLAPLGKWMAAWRPDGTLLCDAPGAVPYYSGWRTAALANNVSVSAAPDLVALTSQGLFIADMDQNETRIADALAGRYRVLAAIRRDWTHDRAFILYARNDIPELSEDAKVSFPQGIGTVVRLNR